jgi:hypothetical protein
MRNSVVQQQRPIFVTHSGVSQPLTKGMTDVVNTHPLHEK